MAQQNINQYNFKKWYIKPIQSTFDISLASDEIDYQDEVLFSNKIISSSDGNKLPIYFDLNSYYSSQKLQLNYGEFKSGNTLMSINYYNPNNNDLDCYSSTTLCDIGLTGIDNGLVNTMSGQSISYTMGLLDLVDQFKRNKFDRRLKLSQVTGYTSLPNIRFSANTATTLYEIVSKSSPYTGYYNQLYGGFYQGFYKLFGYDYEVFPERTNKGWSVEMLLRPRQESQYSPNEDQTTLNQVYPDNKNTFFYFGTRAENKFYHHASGSPSSDSGYTRVTESSVELKTCACSNTGVTNSRCIDVYEPVTYEPQHNTNCSCCDSVEVARPEKDPLFDSMSNSLSFRLSGDPANPKVCVKVLKFTGDCSITGTCPNTGITYTTGYTVTEYCSTKTIYEYCEVENPAYLNREHWFHLTAVWSRNAYFDECDLYYKGGLGTISKEYFVDSLSNDTVLLIEPPITSGEKVAEKVEIVNLNEQWLIEKDSRLGSLKLYVNGQLFYVINGFEEVIPRALNTEKEKQLGVPFNISWGGGTQGLRESLTFNKELECDISFGVEVPIEFDVDITSGSVNITYTLKNPNPIGKEIIFTFTHVLGKKDGSKITVNSEVIIPANSTIGETVVVIDDDYNLLNGDSQIIEESITPSELSSNFNIDIINNFIPPTPTPTPTPTITVTPTNTTTPTPTPSATPVCGQFITDELSNGLQAENGNDIISEYNICVSPTPTPSITPTNTNTPTITPSNTPTPSSNPSCFTQLESMDIGERTGAVVYNSIDNLIYIASVENPVVFVINPVNFTIFNTIMLSNIYSYFNYMTYYQGTNSIYGSYVYLENSIGIISANTEYSTVSVDGPRGLSTQPNQQRIYIGGSSQIRYLDINTNTTYSIGSLGSGSYHSTYNNVNNTMYFSLYFTNQVKVYDFNVNFITATIDVGVEPNELEFNPSLNRIYTLNETDNTVSVIDCDTNTVIATITGMTNIITILYIPNTTKLLVGSLNGVIYKINCSNNTITCSQDLGTNISGMVYNTNDGFVYASNNTETIIRRFIP